MTMKIGKKISSNKIGKKLRRAAFIGGKGSMVYGRSLMGAGAVATAVGVPEIGVPVMAAGGGMVVGGRAVKKASQGKSVSKIERRLTKDLTGGLF